MIQKIKNFLLIVGALCATWIALFLVGLLLLALAVIFAPNYHMGTDVFTQICVGFYNLPIWGYTLVLLLAANTVGTAYANRATINQWLHSKREIVDQWFES